MRFAVDPVWLGLATVIAFFLVYGLCVCLNWHRPGRECTCGEGCDESLDETSETQAESRV